MQDLRGIALQYYRAGHHVLPVKEDKSPAIVGTWRQYMQRQTEEDVERLFSIPQWGIAIIGGINGLEIIDIDCKYDLTGKLEVDFIKISDDLTDNDPAIAHLAVSLTKSNGYHVYYRCPKPEGSKKLAMRPATEAEISEGDKTKVLIETKGVGGYVVVSPSPGYIMQTGDLENIPEITQSQRDTILTAARSFDEMLEMEPVYAPKSSYTRPEGQSVTPWDDFNDRESPIDLLQKYGWAYVYRQGEKVFLKRPGKSDAKTSGNYHEGRKVFVCHTTSTCLPAEKGLTAWSIYKYHEHSGDASAAARALYAAGYGTRYEKKEAPMPSMSENMLAPEQKKEQEDEFMKQVWASRYVYGPVSTEQANFTHHNWEKDRTYNIGGPGMLIAFTGKKKSGKTFVLLHVVASAISGGNKKMGFSLKLQPGQNVLFVDTEQSRFFFELTQHEAYDLAGVQKPENYYAFHLRRWSVSERMTALKRLIAEIPNLGMIVIDGVVDLCTDMMDYKQGAGTIQELMTICETTGAMVFAVLHLTKQSGDMRGHLGTELGNRCDASMSVEKDPSDNWFTVRSMDSRFSPFPPFRFCRDPETGKALYDTKEHPDDIPTSAPAPFTTPAMAAARPGEGDVWF